MQSYNKICSQVLILRVYRCSKPRDFTLFSLQLQENFHNLVDEQYVPLIHNIAVASNPIPEPRHHIIPSLKRPPGDMDQVVNKAHAKV